jgi:Trk K+ transport system NAD-binding subunit
LALASRFRVTLALTGGLFGLVPIVYVLLYPAQDGQRVGYGEAFHHVYFLMFGQPSLPYVDSLVLEALNLAIPPFGIAVIVDGVVRLAVLAFSRQRSDKDWIAVIAKTYQGHVVVCGAGRVGYRVTTELVSLGCDVVVIEKDEHGAFVSVLRDQDVPVLIDDIKSRQCLERTHIRAADAIVCATDNDLANLNVALDARRFNPKIRIVMRLFDDDLVATIRDAFSAEALSTSAVAAPAMALAALDPRIIHSFRVGKHLMVVSDFVAGPALTDAHVSMLRDRFGGLTLSVRRADVETLHPNGQTGILGGDVLTVQAAYDDYLALRAFTGERVPPVSFPR